jgi:vacuolar iron transporter family protein
MRFELGLEEADPKRAPISTGPIAASYLVGDLIPLAPYMLTTGILQAFLYSVRLIAPALPILGSGGQCGLRSGA